MPIEFTNNKRMHELEMHEKTVIFTQENFEKKHSRSVMFLLRFKKINVAELAK